MDPPTFVVAVQNPSSAGDTILVFHPASSSPITSITLATNVVALTYGRESVRHGRRPCIFALTERREVIKIVEGEGERVTTGAMNGENEHDKENENENENEQTISAFDEVFDVDQVEKRAQTVRAETDYSKCVERK